MANEQGGQTRSAKDKQMAAHLRAQGIYHGKRLTSTLATHNYPRPGDPLGSARFKRRKRS